MHISRWTLCLTTLMLMIGMSMSAPVPVGLTDEQLKEKALKLNQASTLENALEQVNDLLKDKDTAKRLVKIAAKLHRDAPEKEPPFKYNAGMSLARLAHAVKEYDAAETLYEFCVDNATVVKSEKKLSMALEGLADLYWEQKKFQGVEKIITRLLEEKDGKQINGEFILLTDRLIQAKARAGDTDAAIQLADKFIKGMPQVGIYYLQAKASAHREAGKYDLAAKSLEEFIEKADALVEVGFKEDFVKRLRRNSKYQLSGLYIDLDQLEKATENLQALIKDEPENPTYYNDLGFVWADRGIKLEESEKLIRKAIDMDAKLRAKLKSEDKIDDAVAKSENAAYLDSLGWVLYQQGKYKEALKYLEKASQDPDDGAHIEIWDHLADCLVKLGEKKRAVEVWQKSLSFDDISKRDVERRKKVTEKLKKLKAELAK